MIMDATQVDAIQDEVAIENASAEASKTSEGKLATECTSTETLCRRQCEAMFLGSQL
jgi:hypothetical protein